MSASLSGQKIAFIGLGNMGRPMARHLHAAGAEVTVWNRSDALAAAATALGMQRAVTLPDLARAIADGPICLNLTTADVVADLVFGPRGLAPALTPGALLIDFGTTGFTETQDFARRAAELGVSWVDAPVSGGQVGAEAATLTIMAGGTPEAYQRALPILQTLGQRITHLGPPGSGQVTKLANQLIVAQTIDAVAQALRLAELAGLDSARVREALLGGFAQSRILELHGDRMVRRDFTPGGRATLQLKDIRLICALAESLGFESPTLATSRAQWEKFVTEQNHGDLDHSGLFLLYENKPADAAATSH